MSCFVLVLVAMLTTLPARAKNVVSEASIHQSIVDFIRAEVEGRMGPEDRCEVNVRWQGDVVLDCSGEVDIVVKRLSSRPFRGPTVVRAELRVTGSTERAMTVTADTRWFRSVLVALHNIRRREILKADMFGLQERDVTSATGGFFVDFSELEGARSSRSIGLDRIVTARHVEPLPVVFRGDVVTLLLESPGIAISARGQAMQDGGLGQQIRVRNHDSGKVLIGEILDSATVRMAL